MKNRTKIILLLMLVTGVVGSVQSKDSQGFLGRAFEFVSNVWDKALDFVKDTGRKVFGGKEEQKQEDLKPATPAQPAQSEKPAASEKQEMPMQTAKSVAEKKDSFADLSLREQVQATATKAQMLAAQKMISHKALLSIETVLQGMMNNNLEAGEDNVITTKVTGLFNNLQAVQEGALKAQAFEEMVNQLYQWWFKTYDVADQYQAGGLSPEPVQEALFDEE